jgi:hypothetical protein
VALSCSVASAEIIHVTDKLYVNLKVRKDGTIRAEATVGRIASPQDAYRVALRGVAMKTKELGYRYFAVVTAKGGTMMMSGIAVNNSGRVVAKPVKFEVDPAPGAAAPWFSVEEVLNAPLPFIPN